MQDINACMFKKYVRYNTGPMQKVTASSTESFGPKLSH